jgi:hypothetical protein
MCGVVLACLAGCDGNESTETKAEGNEAKVVRGVDTKRIPVPNHGPKVMAGEVDKAVILSNPGKLEAKFHDKPRTFQQFSPGLNAATYSETNDVGRIMVTAAKDESGYPRLALRIENVRLDEMKLPVTFPLSRADKKKVPRIGDKDPAFSLQYEEDQVHTWNLDPKSDHEVTLTSFEGKTLSGSFKARLLPKVETMGEVIEIEHAEFEVELRLRGIKQTETKAEAKAEPGPTAQ